MRTANVHRVWLKHQRSFNRKLGPLSDTLQAGARLKLTHIASLQFLPSGQHGLRFGYCFSGPLPLHSHKGQVTFLGPFLGVPNHLDYTRIGQNHLSIEAQCDHHNSSPMS